MTAHVPPPHPVPAHPLDLRIESLAVAGDAHGLHGESLTDYVVAHCLDALRSRVGATITKLRQVGRIL